MKILMKFDKDDYAKVYDRLTKKLGYNIDDIFVSHDCIEVNATEYGAIIQQLPDIKFDVIPKI